ncbi:hypothetical protein CLV77_1425 [Brevirhabdus pacifica]|uniref:Pam3-gp28 family putative phage holin n=1 Tax=Brevirhabdus pacifica TaxID=1267768 RepID=UPI000CB56513|nr:hypothetical protein [Brevirhabdus pacifica]PJJ86865.1 hypothetical protein CLV77_1425 [Brevirhabdus pacifica]
MTEDIKRLVRHLVPVAVIYAVSRGWIPEAMQADMTEAALILSSVAFSLIWSKQRDLK